MGPPLCSASSPVVVVVAEEEEEAEPAAAEEEEEPAAAAAVARASASTCDVLRSRARGHAACTASQTVVPLVWPLPSTPCHSIHHTWEAKLIGVHWGSLRLTWGSLGLVMAH